MNLCKYMLQNTPTRIRGKSAVLGTDRHKLSIEDPALKDLNKKLTRNLKRELLTRLSYVKTDTKFDQEIMNEQSDESFEFSPREVP